MSTSTSPNLSDRDSLAIDFAVRLYTALRTMRLYPAANPQVERSNSFFLRALESLRQAETGNAVILAVSDSKVLICGTHLPDKDQLRPQVQGLTTLFNRLQIYSLTFTPAFHLKDCVQFISILSELLGEKELNTSLASLLAEADLHSVTVDTKRYVAIHEGEQVVKEEMIGSGLNISDEELAEFVLGKTYHKHTQGISEELINELINRLPVSHTSSHNPPSEELKELVIHVLQSLSKEPQGRPSSVELSQSAQALSLLSPELLAKFINQLPSTQAGDEVLSSTFQQLDPLKQQALIANLLDHTPSHFPRDRQQQTGELPSTLERLASLHPNQETTLRSQIQRNRDAHQLLLTANTTLGELPDDLLQRLRDPNWSAHTLATAAQQISLGEDHQHGTASLTNFNRVLMRCEHALSAEEQQQIAEQAGSEIAAMEGIALGSFLSKRFKGLLGEQLYQQILLHVSDEQLDENMDLLSPQEVNQMVAALVSNQPLNREEKGAQLEQDAKNNPVLTRLIKSQHGPEIAKAINRNLDARHFLINPDTPISDLPEHLRARLLDPEWSSPVITAAVHQVADTLPSGEEQINVTALNRLLERYEQVLSQEQQHYVAKQAGGEIASMEGHVLSKVITKKFKGLFGDQLYRQILTQTSDALLDETVEHLTPKQLNRMIAALTSDIPLQVGKEVDSQHLVADDQVLSRLAQTAKGQEVKRAVTRHLDAKQQLLSPHTTLGQLPDTLLQRIKDPTWTIPLITAAMQQVVDAVENKSDTLDFSAFNRMMERYDQVLSPEQQEQIAQKAGNDIAASEEVSLGTILGQKFKGLLGEQLYRQIITQTPDQVLNTTLEQLSPGQLTKMIAILTSDIPLKTGTDTDSGFLAATDPILKRLASTSKGEKITQLVAQSLDAHQLLYNAEPTTEHLPEQLRERLKNLAWSAPVIATAVQQVNAPEGQVDSSIDQLSMEKLFARYEQLLSKNQQQELAQRAAEHIVALEGTTFGTYVAQRFRGLFGEQVYREVLSQAPDELLDQTIEHLTPRQLNRMITALTEAIPLHLGEESQTEPLAIEKDPVIKRMEQTTKGPQIINLFHQTLDARVLQSTEAEVSTLPEQLKERLQQSSWSAPVLVTAAEQMVDPLQFHNGKANPSPFDQLLEKYNSLLNKEKQLEVASQAGAMLASFDERELGILLIQKYKNIFGEQLYQQVISHMTDEKFERLVNQLQALHEGKNTLPLDTENKEVEEAYKRLLHTVRGEKMRTIIEMHREQKREKEKQRREMIQANLEHLLQGELKGLEQYEISSGLAETFRTLLKEGKQDMADDLLMQLASALQHPSSAIQINAASALASVAEQLADLGQWQRLDKLLPALQQATLLLGEEEKALRQAIKAMEHLAAHYLNQENYSQSHEIIQYLKKLSQKTPEDSSEAIQEQAAEALMALSTRPVLNQLLDKYLHSDSQQRVAGKLLTDMGPRSAKFQLHHLMTNESRYERKKLLALIKQTGNPAVVILQKQLQEEDSPWYVTRNIIRLLGEIGNEELFATVRSFMDHEDIRVQQEVVNTALKIGGERLKDFLFDALQFVNDEIKGTIVSHIAQHHDERFVRPLTDLIESSKPFRGKNKNDLHLAICKTLTAIGSKRAIPSLTRISQSKQVLGLGGYSEEVRQAAHQALEQIRMSTPIKGLEEPDNTQQERISPHVEASAFDPNQLIQEREREIFSLAEQGQKEQATHKLLDLITLTARAGDFPTAERLRERIYEIDSLALGEIIRAGEIIDQEKHGSIREQDLHIWAKLTDSLSSEEFQAIYHEFLEQRYKPEDPIIRQGEKNDSLFFINQGSLKVSHQIGQRELFITTLNRGEIIGENFFTPSLWTINLTSLTPSRIYALPQGALQHWQEQFPGLRAKLHEFYIAHNNIRHILKKKGLERRLADRFNLSRKVQVQPINTLDHPIGRGFKAETADISQGGLAFLIRISRRENARLLLGRRMQITLPVGGREKFLYLKGLVIGIQPQQLVNNDFSVHFRFELPLESSQMQTILG